MRSQIVAVLLLAMPIPALAAPPHHRMPKPDRVEVTNVVDVRMVDVTCPPLVALKE